VSKSGDQYRPCVAIALFDPKGRVLVAERNDMSEAAWQLPQGGIDDGETAPIAALRELTEEIGTSAATPMAEVGDWINYDFPGQAANKIWRGRYRGQRVKMLAFRFTGSDADINLDTDSPEFRSWRWAELEELPGLIVPFKRVLYEAAVSEFTPLRDALRDHP
jgi:putative (di)nucleoside polyphosphate hydrolase